LRESKSAVDRGHRFRRRSEPNTPTVAPNTIRYLQQNGGVPLDHPRRCVAHTHHGTPCRRYAARGANVCRVHGGAAPQVVAKARERLALAAVIDTYLSPEHRDNPETGCAVAALANDVARGDETARAKYTTHVRQYLDRLARRIPSTRACLTKVSGVVPEA
jgi:hypothetical protein